MVRICDSFWSSQTEPNGCKYEKKMRNQRLLLGFGLNYWVDVVLFGDMRKEEVYEYTLIGEKKRRSPLNILTLN